MKSAEHVDLHALYKRKVRLGYTPDILTDAGEGNHWMQFIVPLAESILSFKVADTSVMLALMAGRNAGTGVTLVKEGKVSPTDSIRLASPTN